MRGREGAHHFDGTHHLLGTAARALEDISDGGGTEREELHDASFERYALCGGERDGRRPTNGARHSERRGRRRRIPTTARFQRRLGRSEIEWGRARRRTCGRLYIASPLADDAVCARLLLPVECLGRLPRLLCCARCRCHVDRGVQSRRCCAERTQAPIAQRVHLCRGARARIELDRRQVGQVEMLCVVSCAPRPTESSLVSQLGRWPPHIAGGDHRWWRPSPSPSPCFSHTHNAIVNSKCHFLAVRARLREARPRVLGKPHEERRRRRAAARDNGRERYRERHDCRRQAAGGDLAQRGVVISLASLHCT
jgi:hypothetical protein